MTFRLADAPAVLILLLYAAALAALAAAAGGLSQPAGRIEYLLDILVFSIAQALVSAVLSLLAGAVLALALNRHRVFRGRRFVLALLSASAALPPITIVFGVFALFGASGLYGALASLIGHSPSGWIYGWPGILIAHAMLNAPYAARLYLEALEAVPGETLRNAAALRFSSGGYLRFIDAPALRRVTPGLFLLVTLACFTSFAIVLTLGGGPDRSTLEVALYTALRVEVDFARGLALILVQMAVCALIALPILKLARPPAIERGLGRLPERREPPSLPGRLIDLAALLLGAMLVAPPFLALLAYAPSLPLLLSPRTAQALITSLMIAIGSAALCVVLAAALASRLARPAAGFSLAAAFLPLLTPSFALMAGLFALLRLLADPFALALPIVAVINAMAALPFAVMLMQGPARLAEARYGKLADSLRLSGLARWRRVSWPALRHPALVAGALAAAFSLGDYGVVAFFSGGDILTLPLLIAERLSSYRLSEAGALSLLTAMLTLALAAVAARHADR
jgi:thiamine transport system permease protein